jgi:flagellar hook-associated protein 2
MGDVLGGQLQTNENGVTRLTGAGSDINFGKQIDKIIEAKRQPAVRLENRVQTNQTKVDALNQLQQRLVNLREAANSLRGRVSLNNQGNVFEGKRGFLSATRSDNKTPSEASSILNATIDNDAQVGTRSLEVLQTAQRQRVSSDEVVDPNQDQNLSGSFRINGRTVTVQDTDSLQDIAEGINNAFANVGDEKSVSASITNISATEAVLSVQGPIGESINFEDTNNGVLESLGILASNKAVKNQNQSAEVAKFRADGQADGSVKTTLTVSDATTDLKNLGGTSIEANDDLQFTLTQGPTVLNARVENIGNKTLQEVAKDINGQRGVNAEVVESSSGVRLQVAAESTNNAQQSDFFQAGQTLDQLGIDSSGELAFTVDNNNEDTTATTETVNLQSTDQLSDVVNRINNNTSIAAARLTTNSDGQESIVVESTSGERIDVSDGGGGTATDSLSFAFENKGGTQSRNPSAVLSKAADPGADVFSTFSLGGVQDINFEVFDKTGGSEGSFSVGFNFTQSPSLQDIRDQINDKAASQNLDLQASIVNDGGQDRLLIKTENGTDRVEVKANSGDFVEKVLGAPAGGSAPGPANPDPLIVSSANTDATGSSLAPPRSGDPSLTPAVRNTELGTSDADVLTRKSNKVEDLFEGTTINLLKAEKGTAVEVDIERDLKSVKDSINQFVESFNSVKQFINAQRQGRALEGQDPEAENTIVGALQGENVLDEVERELNGILRTGAQNSKSDLTFLGALEEQSGSTGISFVDNDSLSDPTKEDTLRVNEGRLNDVLLNNFNDVRKLFEFDFRSPNSGLTLIGNSDQTGAADGTLNVEVDANDNIVDGGTLNVEVDGQTYNVEQTSDNILEVKQGPLQGLTLSADLAGPSTGQTVKSVDISTSRGVGFNTFQTAEDLGNSNPREGVVESEIARLVGDDSAGIEGQNERFKDEIERIERRLENERERLLRQFTTAEQALIELDSAQQRLAQFAGGGGGNTSNG